MNLLQLILSWLNSRPVEVKPTPVPEPVVDTPKPVEVPTPIKPSPRDVLYRTAKSCLGMDASPSDEAPDEYGCMESVDNVVKKAFGRFINDTRYTPTLSTLEGFKILRKSDNFVPVQEPLPGDIILSPTSLGNGNLRNGHVGIVGFYGIMSNDSATGRFMQNYTLKSWTARYKDQGGFPILFYRRI